MLHLRALLVLRGEIVICFKKKDLSRRTRRK